MFAEYAKLRTMLLEMEREFGLGDLNSCELDVLAVIESICSKQPFALGTNIVAEVEAYDHSRATAYRSLSKLVQRGMVSVGGTKRQPEYFLNTEQF